MFKGNKVKKMIDLLEYNNNEKQQQENINILQEDIKKFMDLFLDDYFLIFISNNFDLSNPSMLNSNLVKDYIKI